VKAFRSWFGWTARGRMAAVVVAGAALILASPSGAAPPAAETGPTGPRSSSRDPQERFKSAGESYEAGKYEEAAGDYESLLGEGYEDPRIYYNLGNARFKQGRLGPAILAYERAIALDPSDGDARENLSYAAMLISDKVGSVEEEFPATLLGWLERQGDRAVLGLVAASLLAGLVGVRLWFDPSPGMRRALRATLGVLLPLIVVLFGAAAVGGARAGRSTYAVVLADSADGRSAPAAGGTVLFTIHEGLKVELREARPGWLQVTLPNGLTGWIEEGKVERI
jgi:hypothetical protein